MNGMRSNENAVRRRRSAQVAFTDTSAPLFKLKYNNPRTGEAPQTTANHCYITIEPTGSSTSKFICYVDIGSSATVYDQWQFAGGGTVQADPQSNSPTIVFNVTTTLGAMLQKIDELLASKGIETVRLNAPADYALETDDFIALAVTRVSTDYVECGYKDASEVLTFAMRLGIPETQDNGNIGIAKVVCTSAAGSTTDAALSFKISRDPNKYSASDEVEHGVYAAAGLTKEAANTVIDNTAHDRPAVLQGPLLLEFTGTTFAAAAGTLIDVFYFNDNV